MIPAKDIVLALQTNMMITEQINHLLIGGSRPKSSEMFEEIMPKSFVKFY